jgi:hypothetical protein
MFDNLFSSLGVIGTLGVVGGGLAVAVGVLLIEFALVGLSDRNLERLVASRRM